mgnify:CR=1 FL=1
MGTTLHNWASGPRDAAVRRSDRSLLAGSIIAAIAAVGLAVGMAQPANATEAAEAAPADGTAVTATTAVTAAAAPAMASAASDAEKLRRLDIMLMVTGLRCRSTADNFMEDYGRFTARHMSELNNANRQLRTQFAAQYGVSGADRALDRMSVVMANEYGGGHPWLSCAELHQIAQDLSGVEGRATLVEAADQLLDGAPRQLLAVALPAH